MKQTKTPDTTSSPKQRVGARNSSVGKTDNPTSVFISMALDMSWRLALVFLVPVIGGFELDQHFKTEPYLVILGFVIAIAGMIVVMKQTVQSASQLPVPKKEQHS